VAFREWPPALATSPRFWPELLATFRAIAPLVAYLNAAAITPDPAAMATPRARRARGSAA
jgi:hypothetical protein